MRATVTTNLVGAVCGLLSFLACPAAILAQELEMTVVERRIAEQNPCRDLKTTQLGIPIGIDVLQDIALDTAEISLIGDAVSVSLAGRIACQSSEEAIFSGNAAASITASANLLLSDCSIGAHDVTLSDFGGDFGPILEALAPLLEERLAETARGSLVRACEDFRGG
jgi:hypothetical protein